MAHVVIVVARIQELNRAMAPKASTQIVVLS